MGYRNYLGSLPKKEYNKIKRMTIQELYVFKNEVWVEDYSEGYVGVYDVAYNTHYELGKYVDQFDKTEDWIELYNSGSSAVDLSGWHLSDKESKPEKWEIPDGVVTCSE